MLGSDKTIASKKVNISVAKKKQYCVGMNSIKNYGLGKWSREFFEPFPIEETGVFFDEVYNTYKELLACDLSRTSKDVLSICFGVIGMHAHFLYKHTLLTRLQGNGYEVLHSENEKFEKFSEATISRAVKGSAYLHFKDKTLSLINKSGIPFGFQKTLNIGGARDRLKSMYSRKHKFYREYRPAKQLLEFSDSLPSSLLDEHHYIVAEFYKAGSNIFDRFCVNGDRKKALTNITDRISNYMLLFTKLYVGSKRHMASLDCDYLLASSLGSPINRTIAKAAQANNTKVVGFSHGNPIGIFYDKAYLLVDCSIADTYVVQTGAMKVFFENLLKINSDLLIPQKPAIEDINDNFFLRMRLKEQRKPVVKKIKKVMIIQSSVNDVFTAYHRGLYYTLQLDLTLRIMSALKKSGYYVIIKLRTDRLKDIEYGGIFKGYADQCVGGIFEDKYEMADALIFPQIFTTTFGFSLPTNKRMIYFLYEEKKYIQDKLTMLNKRCTPIHCWFDERNRIQFKEEELIDALGKEYAPVDTEFLESQLFPKNNGRHI